MSGRSRGDSVEVGSEIARSHCLGAREDWAIQETAERVPELPFATAETFHQERVKCAAITEEDRHSEGAEVTEPFPYR
jgi:hypothetical protein